MYVRKYVLLRKTWSCLLRTRRLVLAKRAEQSVATSCEDRAHRDDLLTDVLLNCAVEERDGVQNVSMQAASRSVPPCARFRSSLARCIVTL